MPVTREEAIRRAIAFYVARGATVIRRRDDLTTVRADSAFVLLRVVHSSEMPFRMSDTPERFWWVAFEELERTTAGWEPARVLPSGGAVWVDEAAGGTHQPPIL